MTATRAGMTEPLVPYTSRPTFSPIEGHSLVEVLVAMAAGLVVLGAAMAGVGHLRGGFTEQREVAARQQDARIGLAVLASELGLAGLGLQLVGQTLLTAAEDEVAFYANLSGLTTHLTRPSAEDESVLHVRSGAGWRKGKRVFVCDEARCLQGRLAKHGRREELTLLTRLETRFPAGSLVVLANHVRYYLRRERDGLARLMRMVDGGASTLVGGVTALRLSYLGPEGGPALDPATIASVRIELELKGQSVPVRRLVSVAR